jgi:hypothetical protein
MPGEQINVEFFFRLAYECFYNTCRGSVDLARLYAWAANLWIWIIIIGYIIAVIALIVLVYTTMRLFELRKREEEYYTTIIPRPGSARESHPRFEHIRSLIAGMNPNDWRTAIIEADIMLDEMLTERGYTGAGVGEKLKTADPEKFSTLNDAWEAHKVRNQIAHEGSAFNIPQTLAERTIGRYESVFREFKVI